MTSEDRLAALEAKMQDLLDRQAIFDCIKRSSRGNDRFDAELTAVAADILANSWYANQVNKRALIEIDGLSLRDSHGLEMFKNEGLAPDAAQRIAKFTEK